MDIIIRKLPFIGLFILVITLVLFGNSNAISGSIAIGLAFLASAAVFYKIRVDDYKKLINPALFLICIIVLAIFISSSLYYFFG